MKTKREAPKRRGGNDRRVGASGSGGSARKARRISAEPVHSTRPGKTPAPAREGRTPRSGPQTSPVPRPVERPVRAKSASQAKARAKARKAKAPKVVRPRLTERLAARLAAVDLRPRTLLSRVPFVVLVIGALGVGLGLTLWLSTASAERSYQLSHAREQNRLLQQQKEALERDVREAESAPALAEAARKQGMIPTRDTAHLVQDPAGNWVVVGTPKPADGVPPPPLNAKLPDEGPPPPRPEQSPEVPVRIEPAPGAPGAPARSGPEMLLRAPDGASTVGGQHLPAQQAPLPGTPGGFPAPGQLPGAAPLPGLPAPGVPLPAPAPVGVPVPLGGLPAPAPAEVPVPLQLGTAPEAPQAAVPVGPGAPAPLPATAGQFPPPAVATPGVAG
ncbi:FtsB family cell division protein [Mycobacterium sp. HUMS_1102779]